MKLIHITLITLAGALGVTTAYLGCHSHDWFGLAFGAVLSINASLSLVAFHVESLKEST